MDGNNGEKISAFVKMNNVKGKLEFFQENPDKPRLITGQTEGQNCKQLPDKISPKQENSNKSFKKLKVA